MTAEIVNTINTIGSSNTLVQAFQTLQSLGFFTVVPSVLLTLAVIYGILDRIDFPKERKLKGLITVVLAFALFVFANALEFVVGYITDLYSLVFYLMIAYLGILILGGLIYGERARQGSAWIPTLSLLAIFAIGFYYLKFQSKVQEVKEAASILDVLFKYLQDPAVQTMLVIVIFFIAIIWWLSQPEKPKEEKKPILEMLRDLLRKEAEKEFGKTKS